MAKVKQPWIIHRILDFFFIIAVDCLNTNTNMAIVANTMFPILYTEKGTGTKEANGMFPTVYHLKSNTSLVFLQFQMLLIPCLSSAFFNRL